MGQNQRLAVGGMGRKVGQVGGMCSSGRDMQQYCWHLVLSVCRIWYLVIQVALGKVALLDIPLVLQNPPQREATAAEVLVGGHLAAFRRLLGNDQAEAESGCHAMVL